MARSGAVPPPWPVALGSVYQLFGNVRELHEATRHGRLKELTGLLKKGVGVEAVNDAGQTPLFIAALLGHSNIVSQLLHFGANPNRVCADGSTPTLAAAFSGNPCLMNMLLLAGADIRICNKKGHSVWDWANEAGPNYNTEIIALLSDYFTNIRLMNLRLPPVQQHRDKSQTTSSPFNTLTRFIRNWRGQSEMPVLLEKQYFPCDGQLLNLGAGMMISGPNRTVAYLASVPFIPSNNLVAVEGENPFYNGPNIIMTKMHWGKLRVSVRELHLPAGTMDRESALANNLLVEEQRVLCSLRHPGLLCLMGISLIHEIVSPRLVFERVHLGSLFFMLHTKQSNSLGMLNNTKIHLLIQVCEALQYLHDQGWIHCAITSHAIYMVSPTIARLGGLCYAKKRDSVNPCISTPPIVWNRWLPIEVIRGSHRIDTKSDVYSICTIIHEILTGSLPWANVDDHDVRNLLSTGYQHPVDDCVSESLSGILHVGLAVKARHRHLCLQDILNTLQSEHTASIKKSTCCYSDATILQDIPLSRTTLHTAAKSDPFNICSEIPEKLLESQNQHDNHGATGEMRWCAWREEGLQELLTCTNEFFTPQRILSTHVVNEDPDISDSSTGTFERNMDSLVDTYIPQSSSEDGESATEPPNDTTCSSPNHQMWDTDSVQDDTHNPHIQDTIWHMSVTRSRDSRTENVSHWQSALDIQPQNITIKQTSDIQKSESCDRSLYKSFLQDDDDQDSIDTERKESQSFPPKDLGSDETFKFKETVIEAAHVSVLEDKTASEQFLLVCRSPMAFEDISEISNVVPSDTADLPLTSHKALLLHFPQSTPVNREMKLKIIRLKNRETAASLGHDYSLNESSIWTMKRNAAEKMAQHVDLEIEDDDQVDDDGWLQCHTVGDVMENFKEKKQFVAAKPDDGEDLKNSGSITDTMMNSVFLTPEGIELPLTKISGAEGALLRGSLGYDDNYPLSPAQPKDFSVKNKQDEQTTETSDKPFAEKTTEHVDLEIEDDDQDDDDGWLQYYPVGDIMEDVKEKTQFVAANPDDSEDSKYSRSLIDTINSVFLTPGGIEPTLTEISGAEGALLRGSLGYDDNYPLSPAQPKDFSVKNKQDEQTAETSDNPFGNSFQARK